MTPHIIYFDLETTGLNYYHDRIIEVAAQDNARSEPFARLAHTEGSPLPAIITRITGITDAKLETEGISEEEALRTFKRYCGSTRKPVYLVAHNNEGFDRWFLCSRMQQYGIRIPPNWRFFDSLQLAKMLFAKRDHYSLQSLCKDFGIQQIEAHRAGDDVRCLRAVTERLFHIWNARNAPTSSTSSVENAMEVVWQQTQLV